MEVSRIIGECKETDDFADFLDSTTTGLGFYCLYGNILKALKFSSSLSSLSGFSNEEYEKIVTKNAWDVVVEEDRERVFKEIGEAIEKEREFNITFQLVHKDKAPVWVHANAIIKQQTDKVLIKAIFMKMANETILYQDIANQAINGSYVISRDYKMLYVNRYMKKLLHENGVKEILGKKCYEVVQNRKNPCPECGLTLQKAVEISGDRSSRKYQVSSHDVVWNDSTAKIVYVNDVTKQKKEEQKVFETRKNLSIAMEHAKMLYWEYDFADSIAYVNEATQKCFGLSPILENYPESYLSMNYVSKEDTPIYRKNIYAVRDGAEYTEFVAKIKTLQTDYIWMKIRFTGIKDEQGIPFRAVCTAEVITEYKELEERFQTILAQNHIESWIYDIQKHTLILTQGQQEKNIYKEQTEVENVPESHIQDGFCYPDDVDKLRGLYQAINQGEKQVTEIIRFFNVETQTYRWKQCSYTTIFDKDNQPLYAVGSAVDVSEKMEAKRRYEAAVEYKKHTQLDNQIWSAHCNITKNRIIEISDGMGKELINRFTDKREAFFKGIGMMIVNESQRREFYSLFSNEGAKHNYKIGNSQASMECSICFDKATKDYKWVQLQLTVVMEPITKELEGFIIAVDKSAIRRQQNILNAALQWDYDFVASINLLTDKINVFKRNQEDIELIKEKKGSENSYRERFEFAGTQIVVEQERDLYRKNMSPENILKRLEKENSYEFTYHIQLSSGEVRAKRARFTAYADNRNLVVLSQTDVTDMLAEQERQKNTLSELLLEAQKANQAKSDFLSRISHDMRTPLNGILGITNLMKDETDWTQIKEDLTQLQISGQYLLNLINDTLDVSKIESGKMSLQPMVCEGKTVLKTVLNLLQPNIIDKKINFITHIDNLPFTLLYIDVGRIQQLVMNILGNAIKFTPEYGTIEISMVNLKETKTELIDRIVIRDTGIGINPDFLPYLFEPFSQENTNRTSKYQGTGLGMTISKQIVELMGGTISVESEVGKGTTFDFTIHMLKATKIQIEEWKEERSENVDFSILNGKRILMCEDHPLNAQIAKRLLEKMGVKVELASNGKIGVELFERSNPDYYHLILMDIRMPIMDGLEATKKIRQLEHKNTKSIPIIAMTANALSEDIKTCKDVGMNEHIAKPLNPQLMYETIVKYL